MVDWQDQINAIIRPALVNSAAIDEIIVDYGALSQIPEIHRRVFSGQSALIIADQNTWNAAGNTVAEALIASGCDVHHKILPGAPRLKPTRVLGDELCALLKDHPGATPVAVGAGVINDLVKFAAHQAGQSYLCVATAASMDGYASPGAPLVDDNFKITIPCAPPRAIIADIDVIAQAPFALTGWGYGDLAGKLPAGGDWIIADALGIEPIDPVSWSLVQDNLRGWLSQTRTLKQGDAGALVGLFTGLTIVGLAMETHGSSRPASGADHQIAHLWEMEGLMHEGELVSHGACVSIGCLATLKLFDWLCDQDLSTLDTDKLVANQQSFNTIEKLIVETFPDRSIARRAIAETSAKVPDGKTLRTRIEYIRTAWPELRQRLKNHLMGADAMRGLLYQAGAPVSPEQIGVSMPHMRASVLAARFIRQRYTVLDLLDETGLLNQAVEAAFP